MRKIGFIKNHEEIKKLMIYECSEGVYLFGYDCLNDTSCVWDLLYESLDESLEYCDETFDIGNDDWIEIADPVTDCQYDFVLPTKKSNSKSQYKYQSFVTGKWIENFFSETKEYSFGSLTGNERLFVTGLIDEYECATISNTSKAKKILITLGIG